MPRLRPDEVAAALEKPSRTPAQLANDARLRASRGKPRARITSEDVTGAKSETNISATGPLTVEHSSIEVVAASKMEAKARELKFMNQIVTVQIESSEDPDEPVWVHSGNGGTDQYLQRGVPQQIKLMFLYSLIAAKKTAQTSSFGKDGTGKEFNKLLGRTSTTHRLSVIEASPEARKKIAEWMTLPA